MGTEGTVTPVEGTASAKAGEFNETLEHVGKCQVHSRKSVESRCFITMNPLSFLNLAFFLLLENEMP